MPFHVQKITISIENQTISIELFFPTEPDFLDPAFVPKYGLQQKAKKLFFTNIAGALITFDINNPSALVHIPFWITTLIQSNQQLLVPLQLIGYSNGSNILRPLSQPITFTKGTQYAQQLSTWANMPITYYEIPDTQETFDEDVTALVRLILNQISQSQKISNVTLRAIPSPE